MWMPILVLALTQVAAAQGQTTQAAVTKARAGELYAANCQTCHGPAGKGSPLIQGSAFVKRQWKHGTRKQDTIKVITEGVPGTVMLPFKDRLKPEEIAALAALVRSFDPALKPARAKK